MTKKKNKDKLLIETSNFIKLPNINMLQFNSLNVDVTTRFSYIENIYNLETSNLLKTN